MTRTQHITPRVVAVAAMILVVFTGCSEPRPEANREAASQTTVPEARDVISEPLMIALGQAKNYHGKADVYLKDGKIDLAIAAVSQIMDIPFPENAPEGEDVRLDARARIAKLLVSTGELDKAMSMVNQAIAGATRQSFFVANLHTVRGEIFEAKADAASADPEQVQAHRVDALKAYDMSISINEELQKRLLEEKQP